LAIFLASGDILARSAASPEGCSSSSSSFGAGRFSSTAAG
jgi:hypothetical protein